MSRSRQTPQQQLMLAGEEQYDTSAPSKCAKFLYYMWKFCTCVFSHIMLVSLVVSYCILGAFTFESLEAENERKVKASISQIRGNVTEDIWKLTKTTWVLHQDNWTNIVVIKLRDFEKDILNAMKMKGWDGNEDPEVIQWTFAGALFFSIIVITTIGYGHIAPKTHMGKVVTIFYAILGIPLMLLCLSNIGDVMATSFRFLYWRVCCYVCTRKPKRRRHRSIRSGNRQSVRSRSRAASFRKQVRNSQKSADSGFAFTDSLPSHSYSDTECRYRDEGPRAVKLRNMRTSQMSRFSDGASPSGIRNQGPIRGSVNARTQQRSQRSFSQVPPRGPGTPSPRGSSNDRRQKRSSSEARTYTGGDIDAQTAARTPILFNKYALDDNEYNSPKGKTIHELYGRPELDSGDEMPSMRSKSLPRNQRKDLYIEGEFRTNRRERSPRFDRDANDKEMKRSDRDLTMNKDSRGLRYDRGDSKNRDDLKVERDLRQGRANRFKNNLDVEDIPQRFNQRYSPDVDRDFNERRRQLRSRGRYNENSDDDEASPYYDDEIENYVSETELAAQRAARIRKRERAHAPSARIMSPMGISVHRQAKYENDFDIEYAYEDGYYQNPKSQIKPVPIWLCVFLVVSYIIAGAFLFSEWENWPFLDSVYFCFITLTTIGFGDFVPAQGVKANSEVSIALCSLYLLFGISLLAMSFNLVQEEVIANVKSVAKTLGIIKPDIEDDSDDD